MSHDKDFKALLKGGSHLLVKYEAIITFVLAGANSSKLV